MTHLEQKIYDAQSHELDWVEPKHMEAIARIAAKIALELAEKAYSKGNSDGWDSCAYGLEGSFKQFIQDYE